jgi:ribosomal protein S19
MARANWTLPYIPLILFQKRFLKNNMNVRFRNSVIPFLFIEKKIKINIYNGIWYLSALISNLMINLKLGELSYTKRSDTQTHLKKKRKKKPKGKK